MRKVVFSLFVAMQVVFVYGFSEEIDSSLLVESPIPFQIHDHGYWCGKEAVEEHLFDPPLAAALVDFFKKEKAKSLVDFGCGMGAYVKNFLSHQINCKGYDGNPNTVELTGGVAEVLDLSQPFDLKKPFDWVLTLEVGEHLPKQYEEVFLKNLDKHNVQGIVLSWALKGQGGVGHFNEQDNAYVKEVMRGYGYFNDVEAENELRKAAYLPWFKSTIMVFRKKLV